MLCMPLGGQEEENVSLSACYDVMLPLSKLLKLAILLGGTFSNSRTVNAEYPLIMMPENGDQYIKNRILPRFLG